MFLENWQCTVLAEVTFVGRLFQRHGAATPKARSPAVDRRDRRTISLFDAADLMMTMMMMMIWQCLGWVNRSGSAGIQ